ncbi:DEAD/DEAH box helicase [Leifsonia sp. AG29]|uniref:DEAD/DEAH box helicase n=1 Tax=Leifsonia sp. AG29 TaxID=2598860 RepID=UPI001E376898|nr:type ISP restriction/modification enzyme [Leifsonia sp. AG29]
MQLESGPERNARDTLLAEANDWIELGRGLGYFGEASQEGPPALENYAAFESAIAEAWIDVSADLVTALANVHFAPEPDWKAALESGRTALITVGPKDVNEPGAGDWLLTEIGAIEGMPSAWRMGTSDTSMKRWKEAGSARDEVLQELRETLTLNELDSQFEGTSRPSRPISSVATVLDQYRRTALDEFEKGAHFERLMQAFLRTEPQYAELYDRVWLWSEYPGRGKRPDTGIDLVARNRDTGELTAIQCKFFAPTTTVTKGMLDSFLSASGKLRPDHTPEFGARLIISTSDKWGKNAEDAIVDQTIPVERLRVQDLDESAIDWSRFVWDEPANLVKKQHKTPFDYQIEAIDDVVTGFAYHDRGKLIMACGTGKTFTSLRLAEKLVPAGGTVLFLVPSIALLSQTLKEWTVQAEGPLRAFAVCSDVSVGKRRTEEDIPVRDLAFPATTNANALVRQFSLGDAAGKLTVVFSTYQSLPVISKAQGLGLPEFDLIVCDEAHRTTGAAMTVDDESAFMKVHDQGFLQGKKRLYMTATPRIFSDGTRKKAGELGAKLADMDDLDTFGPEFHRLGFGQAVSMGRLTDYKVLVLAVDEGFVASEFQSLMSRDGYELDMEDTAKIVGTWNGLSKRSVIPGEYAEDPSPMQRAVMFAKDIATSKKLADAFQQVVEGEAGRLEASGEDPSRLLRAQARHVDGTQSMLVRNEKLDWLKEPSPDNTVRILSNAKCLSEGVDVPALDAVMFMNPRKSVVDVVQSVGRVMRKMVGKKFGYVILPIAVPGDVEPDQALNNNDKYRVVWQVLQALRAHDERFDAEVNKIDLTRKTERLVVDVIGSDPRRSSNDEDAAIEGAEKVQGALQLDFSKIEAWRDAILSKIVQKVGERRYWENWAKDVADIAKTHATRINALVNGENKRIREEFEAFTEGLRLNLNPDIAYEDAVQMLSQHLITQPVFDALFEGYAFSEGNPVSQVMNRMVEVLDGENLENETAKLEKFYDSVRTRAAGIDDAGAKQTIVKELYEKFFSTAFSKTSERLGIVYTPNEIVDFIVHSVNDILEDEFSTSLSDKDVHILDPFTGTGTFIVRLLQSGLIRQHDLARKYRYELHANEIVLLAYYVAAINIEETYHAAQGGNYVPFDGIVLTDTFQMFEDDDKMDDLGVFQANNDRVAAQKSLDIRVIIGNPPWSVGQSSANDNNQNIKYETLDEAIRNTYAKRAKNVNKVSLYDSYIRAIRWASDRIGDRGIVGFVSNGGFIDSNSADGIRKSLIAEYSSLYVFNLRGNQRTAGEQSRREGGKVFGAGSRATVAIYLLVKNPDASENGRLFYNDIGDYRSREDKLDIVRRAKSIRGIAWERIVPNDEGDWINQRRSDFQEYQPISGKGGIFALDTHGVSTNRDAWTVNFSRAVLSKNISSMFAFHDSERSAIQEKKQRGLSVTKNDLTRDAQQIAWGTVMEQDALKNKPLRFHEASVRRSIYRPFTTEWLYFDRDANHSGYRVGRSWPSEEARSRALIITAAGSHDPFSLFVSDLVPNYHSLDTCMVFPEWTYEPVDTLALEEDSEIVDGYRRASNITNETLDSYRRIYGSTVLKEDIFHYVYAMLHSPDYRARYSADLQKMLPRIPKVDAFREFVTAGRRLSELHLGYENAERFPLIETSKPEASLRVTKMRYAKNGKQVDRTAIVYNDDIVLSGIPEEAHEYLLGPRSALDWIIERYQVKTDKASGIVNDPNEWGDEHGNPRYILDLIMRVTTVSVATVKIVRGLPLLDVIDE